MVGADCEAVGESLEAGSGGESQRGDWAGASLAWSDMALAGSSGESELKYEW